jgi:hypothetical protein
MPDGSEAAIDYPAVVTDLKKNLDQPAAANQ